MDKDRKAAIDAGKYIYRSNKACPRGHGFMRYTKRNACCQCAINNALERYYKGKIDGYSSPVKA